MEPVFDISACAISRSFENCRRTESATLNPMNPPSLLPRQRLPHFTTRTCWVLWLCEAKLSRIFYATRTHKQLGQVVQELRRIPQEHIK